MNLHRFWEPGPGSMRLFFGISRSSSSSYTVFREFSAENPFASLLHLR